MSFLDEILARLETDEPVLREIRNGEMHAVTGRELLEMVGKARAFLSTRGIRKGDRGALLANNGIRWVATDLAMMAEGLIVVPLYARQAPAELIAMIRDSSPALICCEDANLRDQVVRGWSEAPEQYLFEQIFASSASAAGRTRLAEEDAVTIIYTSGTSGEAKGVVLNAGNVGFILGCTSARLDALMSGHQGRDQVFHYLPFCFAASWITLLTCLRRGSLLTLNTDLGKLAGDIRLAAPDYFINVPALLERVRKAVDEQLWQTGGAALAIYSRAKGAWARQQEHKTKLLDSVWLRLANSLIFPTIRKRMIGENLKALISGSAPLNPETQLFFLMLGIPVLQVYGLTETTAICTMDDPRDFEPGRVGPAIPGIEMKLGENDEILVRGPNIFPGYWDRPQETEKVLRDGWFHTGDQGEVNATGKWRIVGRIKNLIILGSGHNIAPEPIEDKLLLEVPSAQQAVLVGNGRGYLSVIVTGEVTAERVQAAINHLNAQMPHYKQIRAFHIRREPFGIDNGFLTANGKLKRDLITQHLQAEIEEMYRVKQAS
jgi:long-chain acyl-CoA synthetase